MNMQTFNAMRSGAKAMQDARGRLDVDQVDDVMDDIKDEMDIAEQVSRRGWRSPALSELNACQSDCLVDNRSEYATMWKARNSASRIRTKCFGDCTLSVVRKSARCEKRPEKSGEGARGWVKYPASVRLAWPQEAAPAEISVLRIRPRLLVEAAVEAHIPCMEKKRTI